MIPDVTDLTADDILAAETQERLRWAKVCGLEPDAELDEWRVAA